MTDKEMPVGADGQLPSIPKTVFITGANGFIGPDYRYCSSALTRICSCSLKSRLRAASICLFLSASLRPEFD